jgi:hypothetical protein
MDGLAGMLHRFILFVQGSMFPCSVFSVLVLGGCSPAHTPFILYLCSASSTCFGSLGSIFPPDSCTLLLACVVSVVFSLALAGSLFPHACSVQMYFGLLVFQLV